MNTCRIPDCPNKPTRKGLCPKHYMRDYRRKQKNRPTYEDGIQEGRQQAVDAIFDVISPLGGDCYLDNATITLKLQGKPLKAKIIT